MTDIIASHTAGSAGDEPEISKILTLTDLPPTLRDAAAGMNWTELMPVQAEAIPRLLAGEDIMVQSQTGSGKTGAFLLPILHRIDPTLGAPQALVLAPTRELAVQVARDAEDLGRGMNVRSLPIYGGVGYKPQIDGLEAGAQLIVGTPGRILDHLLRGTLTLDRLKIFIFDEADRMLSMGFYPDMKQLQRYLPRGLQSAMFSATYPEHVKRLARQFLHDPAFVSLSQDQVHASDVLHVVYKVPAMQKSRVLVKIIEQENPASAIIFCNTRADVHFVSVVLRRFGYDVGEISADLSQAAREEVLEKLRRNKLKFLVATDVAARGIDIQELSHVFQYQPPQDHEAYVHRTGRTGRAGAAGTAISLVSGMEELELEQIAKKFSISMEEREVPSDEELETLIAQRAVFLLEARLREADNIQKERMQRFMQIAADLADNEDSRTLLAMLLDEFYQKTFHAPLEQPLEKFLPVRSNSSARSQAAEENAGADKRRRKRRKKSSAEAGSQKPEPREGSGEAPVTSSAPVRDEKKEIEPSVPAVEPQDTSKSDEAALADFDMELSSILDYPEEESADPPAPKKRRRRRPVKTSRGDTGAPAGSTPADGPSKEKIPHEIRGDKPAQTKQSLPTAQSREDEPALTRRPGENAKKRTTPAKPRKKIFLE